MHSFRLAGTALLCACALASTAAAQTAPAKGNGDEPPATRIAVTIFADYTVQHTPKEVDSDGKPFMPSGFNIGRAYLTFTGSPSRRVAYRVTADIARDTDTGTSLAGSYEYRIKYAYVQFKLDDWLPKGSWLELGIQRTPFGMLSPTEYHYRFQGNSFVTNAFGAGAGPTSDAGVSFYTQPTDYTEVHIGLYNGEGFSKEEVNDQKAISMRGTLKPFVHAKSPMRTFRVSGLYVGDHYLADHEKSRAIADVFWEDRYIAGAFEYLTRTDRPAHALTAATGHGWAVWTTPRTGTGWEVLLRYERFTPDERLADQTRAHGVYGLTYWFPHQSHGSTAVMLDYERVVYEHFLPAQATIGRVAVHTLIDY